MPLVAPQVLGSLKDLVLLVVLQGYMADHLTSSVNVPWWSLTTEVHFYLLVPLLAPLLHRRFGRWALLASACVLSVWWWDRGAESLGLSASLLPGRLPQFLVGALVGIAVRERGADSWAWILARSRLVARAAVVGLVLLGLYLGANGTYHRRGVAFDLWIEPLSGLLLGILLFASWLARRRRRCWPAPRCGGRAWSATASTSGTTRSWPPPWRGSTSAPSHSWPYPQCSSAWSHRRR